MKSDNMEENSKPDSPNSFAKGCGLIAGSLVGTFIIIIFLGIPAYFVFGINSDKSLTPQQKEQKEKKELDNWYTRYSSYDCEEAMKNRLREPSSYERDGNFITTKNSGSEKVIIWRFRAKNGFGGTNVSTALCNIYKEGKGKFRVTQLTE